jgi:hypothetical protein
MPDLNHPSTPQSFPPEALTAISPGVTITVGEAGAAGRQAVMNGKGIEMDVQNRLLRAGYRHVKEKPDTPEGPLFIPQWRSPYQTPFEGQLIPDFYLWHPAKQPGGCLVELKYQETPGSTDQKLHYAVHGYLEASRASGMTVVFAVLGPGASAGARRWCKRQETPTFIVITSLDELIRDLNRRRWF